jgi:trans-aconitate methyltransferase
MDYNEYSKQWSSKRKSGQHPAHDFLEKPAIYSLIIENLSQASVLCLGCGSGEECDYLQSQLHARQVVGLDSAKGLVKQAEYMFPEVEFEHADIVTWSYPEAYFELVFSSLTFHYVEDWTSLFENIFKTLKPGGELIFSCHHPIKWGAQSNRSTEKNTFVMGYTKQKDTQEYSLYGNYLQTRWIADKLFNQLDVRHYHRPISDMIHVILTTGFEIVSMLEPMPVAEAKSLYPDFYAVHSAIPLFVFWKLKKPSVG